MGEDEGSDLTWQKLLTYIFITLSFMVLFALLLLALYMPSLRG